MSNNSESVMQGNGPERMPPMDPGSMDDAQKAAAEEMIAGPRGAVKGPFISMLRSPELMNRLQKVGEYLRFQSALDTRLNEFVMLITARHLTNQFEWRVHYPLALKAGVKAEVLDALAEGRRPAGMAGDEEIAYDVCDELFRTHGVSDTTYRRAVETFGERGVIDMIGLAGYFTTVSLIMNVARTPAEPGAQVKPLAPFPL
ncbi:MAG TPA: carboxymuconolactone decarboxylase family protein [Noviherbaspirillum sp.]|jgi:4-carboxymuconolactone decarboxylase|uniref:carboxymuconolactone decarboxylase family protein n=1 Tax=Noviherbaspirillum sp. TaxID=1926288 RepID=UPI002DDCCDA6|nr:carboxymuconolactone decarboxylase family protein [Noviherbaspirillum sp.]HEV2610342.1 carboxymuconolactone decarboxylase family protein [Noviherbaspirillum sp.]